MIRPARYNDIPLIQSVLNAPANLGKLEAYPDDVIKSAMYDDTTPIFVWEVEREWQGFCWLCQTPEGTKIEEFGVVAPGGGVGKRFLKAVLDSVYERSLPVPVWLYVAADNDGAIRFYEQFGFENRGIKEAAWVRRAGPVADALKMVLV